MILSSADILRVLGGDAIVRQEARVEVVKDRPGLGTDDTVYVYVEKYPVIEEFEAVWRIWILDNSGMGQYVLNALTSLLPSFEFNGDHYTVREFASERTVVKSQAEKDHEELQRERVELRTELSGLQAGVEDRLKAVRDGVDGKDGKDGRDGADGKDGKDGRDGKDVDGTQLELFHLANVEGGIPLEKGQVLTWNGSEWTNLFVPQVWSVSAPSGGGSGDGEGVIISDTAPETRDDGSALQEGDQWWDSSTGVMYVWYVDADSGQWVQSSGGDGGGASTLAGLLDTDTSGVEDGDILVYRTATGNWTAETQSLVGSIDDLSDVDTSTTAPTVNQALIWNGSDWVPGDVAQDAPVDSVNGQTGAVVLTAADVGAATSAQGSVADSAIQPGDNISDLVNDAGYITSAEVPSIPVTSVAGRTGDVVLVKADITDFSDSDYATAAQGITADTAVQPGDNISDLTNDAGYITAAEVPSVPVTSVAGKTGDVTLVKADITDFSDADYATAAQGATADTALQPGDNISELNNDSGYITDAGVTQIVAGDNITIDPVEGTGVVTINGSETGVEEAPLDGNYYVRASGTWVKLIDALSALGVPFTEPVDAGDFTTGLGTAITNRLYDGGNFTNGNTAATDSDILDGGLTTS